MFRHPPRDTAQQPERTGFSQDSCSVTVRSQTVRRCVTGADYGRRMNKLIAFSALAALCLTGCKKKEEGTPKDDKAAPSAAKPSESGGPVTLNASGSTF